MKSIQPLQRTIACIAATALLGACATTQGPAGDQTTDDDPCGVTTSAAVGALAGAVLGGLIDGKRGAVRGAVIGAGTGALACVAINHQSRQTKTAAQAEQDYLKVRKTLPAEPEVTAYAARLESGSVQRGQPLKVNSTLELVNGRGSKVNEVREELVVFNPDGTPFKTGSKPFTANSAGRFENSFELRLPEAAPQGAYALKTNVYVNGKMLATRDLRTQAVWDGSSGVIVASR
ncbi:glycine zipper 2TM domain-containing protein [Rubrivivax gelatinosus]|uniref:glycine zipper 2TM domain-containing protein n=1 Tax=Rubrivivax gelatinosus TaxID=28068 RepID=UPI003A80BF76